MARWMDGMVDRAIAIGGQFGSELKIGGDINVLKLGCASDPSDPEMILTA